MIGSIGGAGMLLAVSVDRLIAVRYFAAYHVLSIRFRGLAFTRGSD